MRLRRLTSLSLVLLLLSPVAGQVAGADEEEQPPAGLSEADLKSRSKLLRKRATTWWGNRKKLAVKCPECKGKGKVRWQGSRTGPLVACPKCEARTIYVDKDRYRICFYAMHSPAFRLQKGIEDRLTRAYEAARRGKPLPEVVKKYTFKELELVDATHGVVHVKKNRDGVARPQRWIWAKDAGEDPTWHLYDGTVDGPWPGDEAPAEPEKPATAPPEAPGPGPTRPAPEPIPPPRRPERPPTSQDRDDLEASKALVKRWGEERREWTARVVEIELGLEGVEGHEEKVTNARTFLKEIKDWLEEIKPFYERAKADVEERRVGVILADRVKVNLWHLKAHRRLELVEKMLIVIVPGLDD